MKFRRWVLATSLAVMLTVPAIAHAVLMGAWYRERDDGMTEFCICVVTNASDGSSGLKCLCGVWS